jgi:hypothetical protein
VAIGIILGAPYFLDVSLVFLGISIAVEPVTSKKILQGSKI